jgi:hypothetical protein
MFVRKQKTNEVDGDCLCAFCKNDREFDLPNHLVEQLKSGSLVLFAGAGISTESREFAADTLYDVIAHELGEKRSLSFPDLMEEYCRQPDGRIKTHQRTL